MNQYYLVKIKYIKEFTDGTLKRVSEQYLIDASSFTEAEARITEEVIQHVRGEAVVQAMSRQDVADIFYYDDSDTWFSCVVSTIMEDADTGKERKLSNNYFLTAPTAKTANARILECLDQLMVSFEVTQLKKTKIVELFAYIPPETEKK